MSRAREHLRRAEHLVDDEAAQHHIREARQLLAVVDGDSSTEGGHRPGEERTECWNCGYERLVFEACPKCGEFGGELADAE